MKYSDWVILIHKEVENDQTSAAVLHLKYRDLRQKPTLELNARGKYLIPHT